MREKRWLMMKRKLFAEGGIVVLLVFGLALPGVGLAAAVDRGERMITNEDLPTTTSGEDGYTFNQMPAAGEAEGSAPGGLGSGSGNMTTEGPAKEPADPPVEEERTPETGGR
jgi:hypothetical protein